MSTLDRGLLLWNIQPPPGSRGWHGGPTPVGALRGVTARQAAWVPAPGRKSIWQLALHMAYWKYAVRRHLEPTAIPRFPRRPANWPAPPARPDEEQWAQDVALLKSEHEHLVAAVRRFRLRRLGTIPPAGVRWTYGELILGIAAHDAYHTGQIQLLKRLYRGGTRPRSTTRKRS